MASHVVRMQHGPPIRATRGARSNALVLHRAAVVVVDRSVRVGRPHELRHRIGEFADAPFALAQGVFGRIARRDDAVALQQHARRVGEQPHLLDVLGLRPAGLVVGTPSAHRAPCRRGRGSGTTTTRGCRTLPRSRGTTRTSDRSARPRRRPSRRAGSRVGSATPRSGSLRGTTGHNCRADRRRRRGRRAGRADRSGTAPSVPGRGTPRNRYAQARRGLRRSRRR